MPVLAKKPRARRSRRPISVRLPEDVEQRLVQRIADTGLSRARAVALLLTFALDLDAELQDVEAELGWYAANRRMPVCRAIAQLTARSLGIESVEADFASLGGTA